MGYYVYHDLWCHFVDTSTGLPLNALTVVDLNAKSVQKLVRRMTLQARSVRW